MLVAKNFKISKCFGCFVPFFFGAFMTSNVLKRLQTGLHRCDGGKRGNFCTKFRWEIKLPEVQVFWQQVESRVDLSRTVFWDF